MGAENVWRSDLTFFHFLMQQTCKFVDRFKKKNTREEIVYVEEVKLSEIKLWQKSMSDVHRICIILQAINWN